MRIKTSQTENYRSPAYKFKQQRNSAKARGVEWLMTFEEWWGVWDASGKWSQRGHRDGQYVMGRHGDTGPYAVGNVSIITSNENHSVQRSRSRDLPIGVIQLKNGKFRATRRSVFIGDFSAPSEARAAYEAAKRAPAEGEAA
jgi:hypothetical protein